MFAFKYQSVLLYREHQESEQQAAYLAARQRLQDAQQLLGRYREEWRSCLDQWRDFQQRNVSVRRIQLCQRYMMQLRVEITRQAEEVKTCVAAVDTARDAFLAVRREREKIERLREHDYRQFQYTQKHREQKQTDDISTIRFNQKRRVS